jgi:hypothetical protein
VTCLKDKSSRPLGQAPGRHEKIAKETPVPEKQVVLDVEEAARVDRRPDVPQEDRKE